MRDSDQPGERIVQNSARAFASPGRTCHNEECFSELNLRFSSRPRFPASALLLVQAAPVFTVDMLVVVGLIAVVRSRRIS